LFSIEVIIKRRYEPRQVHLPSWLKFKRFRQWNGDRMPSCDWLLVVRRVLNGRYANGWHARIWQRRLSGQRLHWFIWRRQRFILY